MKKKVLIGSLALIITILAGIITTIVITQQNVRIQVEYDKVTFKVLVGGFWKTAGVERIIIPGFTFSKSSTKIEYFNDSFLVEITRTATSNDMRIIDYYSFRGDAKSVELFPIDHTIQIQNASGKNMTYQVSSLKNTGKKHNITSPALFGLNMKLTFQDGYTSAQVTKSGVVEIKYPVTSDSQVFKVRLFDPQIVVINLTLGIFNNSFANASGIYVNTTLSDWSYTSQVFYNNLSNADSVNLTFSTTSYSGHEVQGSVRTWNTLNFSKDLRVFFPFIEAGQTPIDKSGDFYTETCTANNQVNLNLDVNTQFPISKFDGIADYWTCTFKGLNITSLGTNISACAYISTKNCSKEGYVANVDNVGYFTVSSCKLYSCAITSNCGSSNNPVILNNTYQHVCFSFNNAANSYTMYVDGVAIPNGGSNSDDFYQNYTRFLIGTRDYGNDRDWNGNISMLRIWYSFLSAGDIANVYQQDVLNTSWQTYQSFSSGHDQKSYSASSGYTLAQYKAVMDSEAFNLSYFNAGNITFDNTTDTVSIASNLSKGIYNYTYNYVPNSSSWASPVIQRTLTTDMNMINATMNSYSWEGHKIQGSMRTINGINLLDSALYNYANMLGGRVQDFSNDNKINNTLFGEIAGGDSYYFNENGLNLIANNTGQQRGYCYRTAVNMNITYTNITLVAKFSSFGNDSNPKTVIGIQDTLGISIEYSDYFLTAYLSDSGGKGIGTHRLVPNRVYTVATRLQKTNCGANCEYWDLWIDGRLNASHTAIDSVNYTGAIYIGCVGEYSNRAWNGTIQWAVAFNRSLTDTEMAQWTNGTYDFSDYHTTQPFSSGQDTENFSASNLTRFEQIKAILPSNTTHATAIYAVNATEWNITYAEEAPPAEELCNITINDTSPQTYPRTLAISTNCTTPYSLMRNGTEIGLLAYKGNLSFGDNNITRDIEVCYNQGSTGSNIAYICSDTGNYMYAVNVTNTSNMQILSYHASACYDHILLNCTTYRAYTGALAAGMKIVNITDPSNIDILTNNDYVGDGRAQAVIGDMLFSTANDAQALYSFNISDELNPVAVGNITDYGQAYDVKCNPSTMLCYVADRGLTIINVTNASNMVQVGRASQGTCGTWWVINTADWGITVTSSHTCGVFIYNTSVPESPVNIANITGAVTNNTGRGMKMYLDETNKLIYIAGYANSVQVYDITDWSNPILRQLEDEDDSTVYALTVIEETGELFHITGKNFTSNISMNIDLMAHSSRAVAIDTPPAGTWNYSVMRDNTSYTNYYDEEIFTIEEEVPGDEPDLNLSLGPPSTDLFRVTGCGPKKINYSAIPQNQTTTYGIDYLCNNGTASGKVQVKLSGSLNTGWFMYASNTSPSQSLINLTGTPTTYKDIYSNVSVGNCIYIWYNFSCVNATSNPGAYEIYGIS